MLSTCAQTWALELQAFSVLPFQQTTDPVEKLPAQNVAFEELIIPDEIHELLRWSDWVGSYKATVDFFDRNLAAILTTDMKRFIDVAFEQFARYHTEPETDLYVRLR